MGLLVLGDAAYDAIALRRFDSVRRRSARCELHDAPTSIRRVVWWQSIRGGGFASNDEDVHALELETESGERWLVERVGAGDVRAFVEALGDASVRTRYAGRTHGGGALLACFIVPACLVWASALSLVLVYCR